MVFELIALLCMAGGRFVLILVIILASSILFSALKGENSNLMRDSLKKQVRSGLTQNFCINGKIWNRHLFKMYAPCMTV